MRGKTKLILVAALAGAALGGAHAVASTSAAPRSPAVPATHGKKVFAKAGCGSCHTLAAARAKGKVGPSFDGSRLTAARIVAIVTKGKGAMPSFKSRLKPIDIKHLATYIVAVRKKVAATEPVATTGEAVWAKGGCGGCHTLAGAGSTGTKGPSLDDRKPSLEQIVETVALGSEFGGDMPAFSKRLTSAEIKLVAAYVVAVRKP